MAAIKDNKCKRIRGWLHTAVSRRLGPEADWLQGHVANCPRCRRRLASWGKVNLAFSFIKAQPHRLDLLMRANTRAISVLRHSLREAPKAQTLKTVLPQPKPLQKYGRYGHSIAHFAACVTILILMKIGVFSSMDSVQTQGQKAIKQYYGRQIGQDLADEVFPA